MWPKAVSIAPQKEAPIHSEPRKAAIPIVVEFSSIRSSALLSVPCSALGKSRWRSSSTPVSTPLTFSTCPKTKRTSSAKGKTASIRL